MWLFLVCQLFKCSFPFAIIPNAFPVHGFPSKGEFFDLETDLPRSKFQFAGGLNKVQFTVASFSIVEGFSLNILRAFPPNNAYIVSAGKPGNKVCTTA